MSSPECSSCADLHMCRSVNLSVCPADLNQVLCPSRCEATSAGYFVRPSDVTNCSVSAHHLYRSTCFWISLCVHVCLAKEVSACLCKRRDIVCVWQPLATNTIKTNTIDTFYPLFFSFIRHLIVFSCNEASTDNFVCPILRLIACERHLWLLGTLVQMYPNSDASFLSLYLFSSKSSLFHPMVITPPFPQFLTFPRLSFPP